ncbi:hypothetical protein FACS1894159_01820 [Bacteroidia bacterium]|nr:hypothetical protein FACS1894159_01820 [Bacteroidia bacterium]
MKTKYIPSLLLAVVLGAGCTDLSEDVYSQIGFDQLTQDEHLLSSYSGKAYIRLQEYCTEQSLWTLNLQAADECAVPKNSTGSWAEPRYGEIQQHNFVPSHKFIRTGWDFCLRGVSDCNEVLYVTDAAGKDFEGKARVMAEMHVLRAFYYFMAVDGWGNVPFSIDFTDKSLPEQKDRAFMFAFIEKEITDNIDKLYPDNTSKTYGRMTQGAAWTLLAKLYLNALEWIGTDRFADAETACRKVIDSGQYVIADRYKDNFEVGNQSCREMVFPIPFSTTYTASDHNAFIIYILTLDAVNAEKFNIPTEPWNGFVCQPDFFQLYDPADTRCADTWLYGQQYDRAGAAVAGYVIDPVFVDNKYVDGRAQTDGAKLWKWSYQDDGKLTSDQAGMDNHFALFRYADVLLMYAESLLRQGKAVAPATGMADFQKIRTRAGLVPFTDAQLTLDALLDERGAELAWEGWRRQDLIRFGKWNTAWWAKPVTAKDYKLYPIPTERLSVNPNLDQNPDYK